MCLISVITCCIFVLCAIYVVSVLFCLILPGKAVEEQKINSRETINTRIQLAVGPQPLRLRNHNSGLAQRIMVKRLETSPHDPLGITDSACKNQSVVVSVQYGPFIPYIPIRSTTIGPQHAQVNAIAREQAEETPSRVIGGTCLVFDFPAHVLFDTGASHSVSPCFSKELSSR
ncbi:hypothetical protein F511_37934 [Dorcoceras hygrometricum]|uniref:Uncharacterized protein n=1 Tax=Dorcoceras hygrometricum TaxID=472368 RepID=A0A2Z7AWB4_9LAMI|nr:hypothetical protein F511_37934 [Dorcoceras hygrometricum]